ncbi:hypothetical protein BKA56DRAFT_671042 [Ilyonectria sp. MPI-CAGE-AT-0026]|nr:hypothetical protein BKA56DRAFT_671042 [Ilyonectria sp. MPI-CAGE-AT-0026]
MVLCPWNPEFYFLEARSRVVPVSHLYQLPTQAIPNKLVAVVKVVYRGCGNGLGLNDSAYRLLAGYGGVDYYYNNCFQVGGCARDATCWRDIKKGKMARHCKECWDKDLCQRCWGRNRGIVGTYHKDKCL